MIRILDCKGVPVVCLKDEGRLGFVGEALYDGENNVKGFLLEGETALREGSSSGLSRSRTSSS